MSPSSNAYHGMVSSVMGLTNLSSWRYDQPLGPYIHGTVCPGECRAKLDELHSIVTNFNLRIFPPITRPIQGSVGWRAVPRLSVPSGGTPM